jgi:hypothetical protein
MTMLESNRWENRSSCELTGMSRIIVDANGVEVDKSAVISKLNIQFPHIDPDFAKYVDISLQTGRYNWQDKQMFGKKEKGRAKNCMN